MAGREARRLIEIGQILERRNERLTEWMRWQAFSGQLTIEYQQRDTALVIDYPLPAGHKPEATVPWTTLATARGGEHGPPAEPARRFRVACVRAAHIVPSDERGGHGRSRLPGR